MSYSDPISDMLTRIRNAHMSGTDSVVMPHSVMKGEIARVLKREGFVRDYAVEGTPRVLRLYLKYTGNHEPVIQGMKRESKPGLRRYSKAADIPKVLGGMGIGVLSTSSGIMTDGEARKKNVGGELLCSVW